MTTGKKILIWLPSPLGDAICAIPALQAFRNRFSDDSITFLAPPFTQAILSPTTFADAWLIPANGSRALIQQIRAQSFNAVILMKNSFGSALTVRLAGIHRRIGYARDGRSFLLTDKIPPIKDQHGHFKPISSVTYYLLMAKSLGQDPISYLPKLQVAPEDLETIVQKFPQIIPQKPLVIIVPGGAFGPSKLWPPERYAACAEYFIEKHNAQVIVSVAPTPAEIQAAEAIAFHCRQPLINLGKTPLSGGQLKALINRANLVITNDTGPRHIAKALDKKVVTLFGPNNPAWTHTDYPHEIRIIGKGPCVPCDKPVCKADKHYCMESITVEQVLTAAEKMFSGRSQ